jgi:phytoene dehydrogenase-like protein
MDEYDYIFVGAGINALTAAAMLGKRGRKVLVLDRNDRVGGCLRCDEITAAGFVHDVMATTVVLFLTSPAYGMIGQDLEARGATFAHSDRPTGVIRADGSYLLFTKDRARNVAAFEGVAAGDGAAFDREMTRMGADAPFLFSLLGGRLWSGGMLKTIVREAWRRGPRSLFAWFGDALVSSRAYLETTYRSDLIHALWAPWGLHCGLGPEAAYSAQMIKVIAFAVEHAGCPIVVGGVRTLLAAFELLIADTGGTIRTGADVVRVLPGADGGAGGVELAGGAIVSARQGVICSTAPGQLYGRLLKDWPAPLPEAVAQGVASYRNGKGNMQIHYALSHPPRWNGGQELGTVALLHVTSGLDGVSRAANEAERGLLPAEPTICVGQPTALDPSRAPEGKAIMWLQLPEAPRQIKGDALGLIGVPADGRWTEAVREAYADRAEALLARHIGGFAQSVIARKVYSPADLEAMNVNLVGGDPYGGFCGLDQFFLWRPFKNSINHRTHIPRLYHIGASTHPGPGLGAGSGFLLASSLS